jgi:hypothetical protein
LRVIDGLVLVRKPKPRVIVDVHTKTVSIRCGFYFDDLRHDLKIENESSLARMKIVRNERKRAQNASSNPGSHEMPIPEVHRARSSRRC